MFVRAFKSSCRHIITEQFGEGYSVGTKSHAPDVIQETLQGLSSGVQLHRPQLDERSLQKYEVLVMRVDPHAWGCATSQGEARTPNAENIYFLYFTEGSPQ